MRISTIEWSGMPLPPPRRTVADLTWRTHLRGESGFWTTPPQSAIRVPDGLLHKFAVAAPLNAMPSSSIRVQRRISRQAVAHAEMKISVALNDTAPLYRDASEAEEARAGRSDVIRRS